MATTPSQLATLASQYGQFDKLLARWAMVYLLEQYTGVTLTAQSLATIASQYGQFDPLLADWAIVYLLQQLVTNGGGGGGGSSNYEGNYSGGSPTPTAPATGLIFALDTSTGKLWASVSGTWTFTGVTV